MREDIKNDRRKPKPSEVEKPGERIDRKYICPGKATRSFYIPVRDENGRKVPEKDNKGNVKYNGDKIIYKMTMLNFTSTSALPTDREQSNCIFILKKDNPKYDDIYEVLEEERKDPSNMVMDENMYAVYRNPEEAEARKRVRELEGENEVKDDLIAKMNAELEAMKAKMEKAGIK